MRWREKAIQHLVPLPFCRKAGPGCEELRQVRLNVMEKIRTTFHNNVRGVLRHYLYQLQPRDAGTKERLPKIEVAADAEQYTFRFELRDMTRPDRSSYQERAESDQLMEQINRFNIAAKMYVEFAKGRKCAA